MTGPLVHHYTARDGLCLAYRDIGAGRPLVLLHGFMASGRQWLDHARIDKLIDHGFRVILPDLRGHGDSARPHDPRRYPPDALADDGLALIDHLALEDYHLGGYSLGGRVTLRMLARGARPGGAIVAGQGISAVTGTGLGGTNHRALTALVDGKAIEPGSAEADTARWIAQLGADPRALQLVLNSLVATPSSELRRIHVPTLVVIGDHDHDHASAVTLAAALPNSRLTTIPGNHWTALTQSALTAAIADFLNNALCTGARQAAKKRPNSPDA